MSQRHKISILVQKLQLVPLHCRLLHPPHHHHPQVQVTSSLKMSNIRYQKYQKYQKYSSPPSPSISSAPARSLRMSKWYVLFSDFCEIQYFIFQNIEIVTSSDIRHAALQRQAKVLRMVSNTRIIGHNHRWLTKREKENIINLDSRTESC